MSKNESNEDPQHEIQTWEDDTCSHLLPYWREMFKAQSLSDNYDSKQTPPYKAIQTKTVELIFHFCNLLKQPLPVYFLTLDIFDNFLANHMSHLWKTIQNYHSEVVEVEKTELESYWEVMCDHIRGQLLLRVLSCLQLASKVVYSSYQFTTQEVKDLLRSYQQQYDLKDIIKSEFRVFKTLNFKLPRSSSLECLELLIIQCCPPHTHDSIHQVAVNVLKFCYLQPRILHKLCAVRQSSLMSACCVLASSFLQRASNTATLQRSIAHITGVPTHMLISNTNIILDTIFK